MGVTNKITSMFTSGDKESLSPSQQFSNLAAGSISLRGGEFISDIYNEDILTPHEEMRAGYRMLHNDPQVSAAIGTRVDMLMGRELTIESDSDETQQFFNEEIADRLKQPLRNALRDMSITGNGYIRILRGEQTGIPVDFEEVQRPHKVYIKFEDNSFEVDKYIIETRGAKKGETFNVQYYDGRRKTVRGIAVEPENMIHLREGSGTVPRYGRSDFLSAIDSYKIKRELLRSQAVIARQKSIPRKIIKVNGAEMQDGGLDLPESGANTEDKDQIEQQLSQMSDFHNPVIYNNDVEVEDFDYDPATGENQDVIKQLGKEVTSVMPDYLTNPEDSNRATAKAEKQTLQIRLSAVRDNVAGQINPVLREISEQNGMDTDVTVSFGEYDFPTREEKIENAVNMYEKGLITKNEARNKLGFDEVDDGDSFSDDGDGADLEDLFAQG